MLFPRDLILGTRFFNSADIDELFDADDAETHGKTRRAPEPGTRKVASTAKSGGPEPADNHVP